MKSTASTLYRNALKAPIFNLNWAFSVCIRFSPSISLPYLTWMTLPARKQKFRSMAPILSVGQVVPRDPNLRDGLHRTSRLPRCVLWTPMIYTRKADGVGSSFLVASSMPALRLVGGGSHLEIVLIYVSTDLTLSLRSS